MENKINYKDSVKELEEIVRLVESQDIDMDVLLAKLKRAKELLKNCKSVLKETDAEVEKVLEAIREENK